VTRRKGVIAALATVVAALANQQKPKTGTTGKFTTGTTTSFASAISLTFSDEGEPGYGFSSIIVRYGKREVKLTGKEIMDALEGK